MIQVILILLVVVGIVLVSGMAQKYLPKQAGRWCVRLIFAVYLLGNIYFTLLSRAVGSGTTMDLRPFGSYLRMFEEFEVDFSNVVGFAALFLKNTSPITGQILNVLLYCPMGYLLPILFPRLKPRRVILIGLLASLATEITQYLLEMGWCETDDVIHNTLGAAIGVWVWYLQSKRLNEPKENEFQKD